MERTLTLDDLREFEQYPGLAVDRKAHFSRFANKTIVHRDYHRNYTLMTYILLFFIFAFIGWIWEVVYTLLRTEFSSIEEPCLVHGFLYMVLAVCAVSYC